MPIPEEIKEARYILEPLALCGNRGGSPKSYLWALRVLLAATEQRPDWLNNRWDKEIEYWNEGSHCNCRICLRDLDDWEAITMAEEFRILAEKEGMK